MNVVVAGGGPAGSAVAITLARAGVPVTLVDRARFPRDKCCGDGLTTGALRRLEGLGLDPGAVTSFFACHDLSVRSPSGRVVTVPLQRGQGLYAAVARRVDLDAALLDVARSLGVSILEGDGVADVEVDDRGAEVALDSGVRIGADYVVAADGARSAVRRALRARRGHPSPGALAGRGAWLALRAYATSVRGPAASELWVLFESSLLPGYAWSFPLPGGVANVGYGFPRRPGTSGHESTEAWATVRAHPFLTSLLGTGAAFESTVRAWPIPTGVGRGDLVGGGGRVLFCGDAAASADPFTGEGIAQALETGAAAGRALARSSGDPASTYVADVTEALFAEQAISRGAQAMFRYPLGARAALRATGTHAKIGRAVGRWLYEDLPRAIALRPALWHRAELEHPGPYAEASAEERGEVADQSSATMMRGPDGHSR